jgi:hypothetical protein
VSDEDLLTFRRGDYIFSHFYNIGIGLTKLAVLALYYRIFTTPKFYTLTICTIVLVSLWIVAMEITLGFACRPIAAWWGEVEGSCLSKAGFTLFTNVSNLLFDLWIFAMPLRPLLGLQGLRDRRLGLCMLFSIGLGTCAISAARLSFALKVGVRDFTCTFGRRPTDPSQRAENAENAERANIGDVPLGHLVPLGILSAWEPCGGILCANLPITYTTLRQKAQQMGDTIGRGLKYKSGGGSDGRKHPSTRSGRSGGHLSSESRLNHDWAQLNDSGAAISSKVSAERSTEMNNLGQLGGIVVQRDVVTNSLYAPSAESIMGAGSRHSSDRP